MVTKNLKAYTSLLSQYSELRVQENRTLVINYLKGNLVQNNKNTSSGVSARVYKGGSWGFASSGEINDESIKTVLKTAADNAAFLQMRGKSNKKPFGTSSPREERDFSTKKSRLSQREIMEFIKEIDEYIAKKYLDLSNRSIMLNCLDMEKTLITSDGAYLNSMIARSNMMISLTLNKDGQPVQLGRVIGGLGQFEDYFNSPEELYDKIQWIYENLKNKAEGVYAGAGVKECIMDSAMAGILAHEAIGHTVEADMVLGGSVARNYMGKEVASPLVSLVDFANSYNGEVCPVPIYIDDEGTKAEDTVIIQEGVLKSYMHSKESAETFGVAPTGNARAYQYLDEPLIRMRNTAILPGKSKLEEMIASVEDGYYLMRPSNGQADTTSEFMFGVTLGYEIKNGKLGRAIKDTTISGIAFDVLKSVTMVSDDMTWGNGGMCGKKQMITVGMGGPAIKCKVNIGGR
jgi:TldD protein